MYDHSFWAKGGGGIIFAAVSAIETALWDLKGKRLGVPVYELLGGVVNRHLPVYANGWNFDFLDAGSWARAVERPILDGFTTVKCYPLALPGVASSTLRHVSRRSADKELLDLAYERVKSLRHIAGPDIEIRLDLCCALTPDQTIRFCQRIAEFDIGWIEEPADPLDVAAYRNIANQITTPLAAGERLFSRYGFRNIIESQSLGIVQPDIGTAGGMLETKKIAAMAEAYGMKFAPHNCASGISTAASAHLGACTSNFMDLELFPYFPQHPNYVEILLDNPELGINNGVLTVDCKAGLGVDLDHAVVDKFLVAELAATHA